MLILIVGHACTGKSTLRDFLEKNGILAIEANSFIAPLREECNKTGAGGIYERYPKRIGAELIEQRYGVKLDHAVVVGLRTVEEYHYFQERHSVKLMWLRSSLFTCYTRCNTRSGRERYDSPAAFYEKRVAADNALGLSDLLAHAEEVLWNEDCSREEFFQRALERVSPFL